jgi:zinc transport system substrate-binding protein
MILVLMTVVRFGPVIRAGTLLVSLVLGLAAASCGQGSTGSERLVVAAFYPLEFLAQRVAPDADVRNVTPAGAEPHDLELTPGDVQTLDDADLVLYLGSGFQPALEAAVEGKETAVDLLSGLELIAGSDEHGHGDEEEHASEDESELELDPHVWLDPMRFALMAEAVGEALGDPAAAADLVADLKELDGELREGLAECERDVIVTSHAAFGYLADAYGLRQVALSGLSPEAEPSPRALEGLVTEVREVGATTVFFETLVSPRVAETVAREAGVSTATLDPLEGLTQDELDAGEDYFSVMRSNLRTLRSALGCR